MVHPPSLPQPLRDKEGEVYRLRVYNEADEVILKAGVAVGRKKQGEVTRWSILADGASAPIDFLCPPMEVKRLRGKS